MTLGSGSGRLGDLKVGVGRTRVLGVRAINLPNNWNTQKLIHLQESVSSASLTFIDWTITVELTQDKTDEGQLAIKAAYENGTKLEFRIYPNTLDRWIGTASVTRFEVVTNASRSNTLSITFIPYLNAVLTFKYGLKYDFSKSRNGSYLTTL